MRFLTGREDFLIATAISLETPTEEAESPCCHYVEQRAERTESVGSAVQHESVLRPAKA